MKLFSFKNTPLIPMGRKKNADAPAAKSAPKSAPKAPASKLPGRKKFPTEKLKALQKKKSADSASSDDSADDDKDGPRKILCSTLSRLHSETKFITYSSIFCSWKDNALSVTLVALIGENKDIKRSLFPTCGTKTSSDITMCPSVTDNRIATKPILYWSVSYTCSAMCP